jgi:hypothetical protein
LSECQTEEAQFRKMKYEFTDETRRKLREKIKKKKIKDGECWRWTLYINRDGYGMVGYKNYKYLAHRLSYAVFNVVDPEQMDTLLVRHLCNNPYCVNPRHLLLGTQTDNMADCRKAGRLGGAAKPKLNEALVREIIASQGTSMKDRVERFGISGVTIWEIDTNKIWPDIQRETVVYNRNTNRKKQKLEKEPFVWNAKTFKEAYDRVKAKCEPAKEPHKQLKTHCLLPRPGVSLQYGRMSIFAGGKKIRAQVIACQYKEQRLRPDGEVTRHLCGVDACCNPDHLMFGTRSQNAIEMIEMNPSKRVKLNADNIRSIRDMHDQGLRNSDIARRFDVSREHIGDQREKMAPCEKRGR